MQTLVWLKMYKTSEFKGLTAFVCLFLQRPEDPIVFLAQYFTDYNTEKVKDEPSSPVESEENENMDDNAAAW